MICLLVLNQKIGVKIHCCLGITLVRFERKYSMLHHNNLCFYSIKIMHVYCKLFEFICISFNQFGKASG
ncbi:hypothetical protein BGI05_05015 [Snodgrassella alvi]|nr:hypothetical protein BGH97_01385 [Snodgrassella alvi]ORF07458.1 hypothetical protein BGH99_09065 [Snodgrassella alvi]ORF14165.1 hypothetical protein BGI02_05690 [Snodgrassella alvi]ORF21037.1 hypothetical protein BGI05_05015 [Snodgrassella alvi]